MHRCKKGKRETAWQARQRTRLRIVGGVPEKPETSEARLDNATRACDAGHVLRVRAWAGRLGNSLLQVANCLSVEARS